MKRTRLSTVSLEGHLFQWDGRAAHFDKYAERSMTRESNKSAFNYYEQNIDDFFRVVLLNHEKS